MPSNIALTVGGQNPYGATPLLVARIVGCGRCNRHHQFHHGKLRFVSTERGDVNSAKGGDSYVCERTPFLRNTRMSGSLSSEPRRAVSCGSSGLSTRFPKAARDHRVEGTNTPKVDHVRPETGAGCGKAARPDLRGGQGAILVPTTLSR
jgi:hypothetical protein